MEHHDSYGGGGIIGEGDVQWMTAASGVLHKEFHEKEWSEKGGMFQMAQLWIKAHDPFVMNTKREIVQAFDDFNQGGLKD